MVLIVPLIVIAIFLYRTKESRIHLVGLTLMVGYARSMMLDLEPEATVWFMKGQDVVFIAVVAGWLLSRMLRPIKDRTFFSHPGTKLAFIYVLYFFLDILYSMIVTEFAPKNAMNSFRWFYFPLSYLVIIDTYRRFTKDEVMGLLKTMSFVTILLVVLYICDSGLGMTIYPYEKYQEMFIGNTLIIRDFTTFPLFFIGMIFAYYASGQKMTPIEIAALMLIISGAFFTYTRSLVLVLLGIILFNQIVKNRSIASLPKIVGSLTLIIGILFALQGVIYKYFPTQMDYFISRMLEVSSESDMSRVTNVYGREMMLRQSWITAANVSVFFGAGLFGSGLILSYDSDWIYIMGAFGLLGIMAFSFPIFTSIYLSLRDFVKAKSIVDKRMALLLFDTAMFYFVLRFTAVVYLYWPSVSVIIFSFVTINHYNLWRDEARKTPDEAHFNQIEAAT